ncbi:MAG TPA: dienelactone hydrolase family protein [Gemmatimonadaceae bacterium]|nr:dienelactone hydrolase family protein [Gemmatimonadaceae bacterium]
MSGTMVDIQVNGRTVHGYLSNVEGKTGPGLVVIQEWWGLVDHIKDVADRFAREGFVALAPDLYHGETTRSPDQAGKMLMALNIAEAGKEIRGAVDHLLGLDSVEPKKVGVVGFCMGGQLALYAACEHPDRVSAAVNFYGIHLKVELHPERLRGPVLAHFGKRDKSVPPEQARALVKRIEQAGKEIEAHYYDAEHAFFNDHRPEVYDRRSAQQAWDRTLVFLKRTLR